MSKLIGSFTADEVPIDWATVGSFMSRAPQSCKNTWDALVRSSIPLGPFSTEEDATILRRVAEWGCRGNGLWVNLQRDMGRSSSSLNGRWRTLKKRKERSDVLG